VLAAAAAQRLADGPRVMPAPQDEAA
jgi:hypothetical protein